MSVYIIAVRKSPTRNYTVSKDVKRPADITCFSHISSLLRPKAACRVRCCKILHPNNLNLSQFTPR